MPEKLPALWLQSLLLMMTLMKNLKMIGVSRVHTVKVRGYDPHLEGEDSLVLGTANSYGTEKISVTFDEFWEDRSIIAVFNNNGTSTPVDIVDGVVEVPPQATAYSTPKGVYASVVFLGVKENSQIISTDLRYKVLHHSPIDGESPEHTPSAWEKVLSRLVFNNKEVLDNLTEDNGVPYYNGSPLCPFRVDLVSPSSVTI